MHTYELTFGSVQLRHLQHRKEVKSVCLSILLTSSGTSTLAQWWEFGAGLPVKLTNGKQGSVWNMLVFIVASEIDALKILLMDVAANNLLDIHAIFINIMYVCRLVSWLHATKKNTINAKLLLLTTSSSCKTDLQFTGLIKTTWRFNDKLVFGSKHRVLAFKRALWARMRDPFWQLDSAWRP